MLNLNKKLSEVQLYAYERPVMHCPCFICGRKFFARTHAKITLLWKSTLRVRTEFHLLATHRALYDTHWPSYLTLERSQTTRDLR